jgi:hypothetical protein
MRLLIGLLVFVLLSCENSKCRGEQPNYIESWNEVIVEIVVDNGSKGGYDIVTTKRIININPVQELYMSGRVGDSISKRAYSFLVDLYRNGEYFMTSRISSETCDTILQRRFGVNEWDYVDKLDVIREFKENHLK